MSIEPRKVFEKRYKVTDQDAIHFMGPDVPPVLSTPSLVNWMELTARDNAAPLLSAGDDTVGMSIQIDHLAATPVGLEVKIVSKLVKVEGRIYSFELEAFDAIEKVGVANHQRASVTVARFASRVAEKKRKISQGN